VASNLVQAGRQIGPGLEALGIGLHRPAKKLNGGVIVAVGAEKLADLDQLFGIVTVRQQLQTSDIALRHPITRHDLEALSPERRGSIEVAQQLVDPGGVRIGVEVVGFGLDRLFVEGRRPF
jgi:hypothetical protein